MESPTISQSLRYATFVTAGIAFVALLHQVTVYFIPETTKTMNTNQDDTKYSKNSLQLPEPNLDNITALSHNLPNTPISPISSKNL